MVTLPQSTNEICIAKLTPGDRDLAGTLFVVMARIFDERSETLNAGYLDHLLGRDDFWVLVALAQTQPVAGLTALAVPLTRARTSELLIYDLAVQPAHRRRGVGRRLVEAATALAARHGLEATWIPVANKDVDALEFYQAIGGKPTAATIFTF